MYTKLQELRARREDGEGGFTLIELLVVVVIIGILVAIAIPIYLHFRQGAQKDSAQSDVKSAIPAIEQALQDNNNAYPAGTPASCANTTSGACTNIALGSTGDQINVSPGNTVTYNLSTDKTVYLVTATGADGTAYYYINSGTNSGQVSKVTTANPVPTLS